MKPAATEESIVTLQQGLCGMPFEYTYLGGSVLSILVTDPTVDTIRVTKDVDVIVNVRTRKQFHDAEGALYKAGFRQDMREDAPVCRWIYNGVTVDVLPVRKEVLGWESKWFEEALSTSIETECCGQKIRVVSAPYFIALKIEAFENRGRKDFITSTDFEDIICLVNGRESIVGEIAGCEALRGYLAQKFSEYIASEELVDAVEGFVQTEDNPPVRRAAILNAFRSIATL